VNACHCLDCKKLSGADYIHVLSFDRAALDPGAGALSRFRKTADSGREVDIARCAQCGVRLWHEPHANPELVFLAAGTLDDSSWIVPTAHIWTKHAAPHVLLHGDALHCEGQPATRQLTFDAFAQIYGA
jgi:hypothetical protein